MTSATFSSMFFFIIHLLLQIVVYQILEQSKCRNLTKGLNNTRHQADCIIITRGPYDNVKHIQAI